MCWSSLRLLAAAGWAVRGMGGAGGDARRQHACAFQGDGYRCARWMMADHDPPYPTIPMVGRVLTRPTRVEHEEQTMHPFRLVRPPVA